MTRPDAEPPGPLDWAGVVVLTLCGLLAGLLETLLVPLYAGSTVVPVAVVGAVLSNAGLPWLVHVLVPRTGVAALPFIGWLVVIVGFGTVARPDGDVILPGSPTGAEYVGYALLLLGAVAGAGALVALSLRHARELPPRPAPPRRRVSR